MTRSTFAPRLPAAAAGVLAAIVAASTALPGARLAAQTAAKRVITQADYDGWRSIQGTAFSRDGRWLAYSLVPQVGDGELVVRATSGTTEYRVPRGYPGGPGSSVTGTDSGFSAPPATFSGSIRAVTSREEQNSLTSMRLASLRITAHILRKGHRDVNKVTVSGNWR